MRLQKNCLQWFWQGEHTHSSPHDIRPCRCQSVVVHLGTSYGFVSDTCCDLLCRSTCIHLLIPSVIRIGTVHLLFHLISRRFSSFSKPFSTSLKDVSSSVFGFAVHLGFHSFSRILETSPCHFSRYLVCPWHYLAGKMSPWYHLVPSRSKPTLRVGGQGPS